ncbi:MAG: outer membrane protein assembly factor BamB family protein [Candidatus Zipacnadales bacterium]
MRYSRRSTTYVSIMLFVLAPPCLAADWPMWGYDAGHTATSPERLSSQLYLQWVRTLPPPKSAWDWTQYRLHFDASYEPVVMGDTLFVPSMGRDSLTAYDLTTGQERWRFYADGPIRLAPAAAHGKVYFVADDGCLYCLDATDGSLCFRFHAAPTARKVLGNERMISTWPGRGGPVLFDGTVYFAAGVWPFMGIFLYALNAETGDVLWENSGSGAMYILQPHNSPAFAGVAPQGHMTVLGDTLLVSAGRSVPAAFDRHTGSFLYFHTNTKKGHHAVQARKEWFLNDGTIYRVTDGKALAEVPGTVLTQDALIGMKSPGELVVQALRLEEKIVTKTDKRGKEIQETVYSFPELWHGKVEPPLERLHLCAGSRLYGSTKNGVVAAIELPQGGTDLQVAWQTQVDGEPYSMLAANGRLIVVTREGRIYCFGAQPVPNVSVFDPPKRRLPRTRNGPLQLATYLPPLACRKVMG